MSIASKFQLQLFGSGETTIAAKQARLLKILLGGFALIGVIYLVTVLVERYFATAEEHVAEFSGALDNVYADFLIERRLEEDLFYERDAKHLEAQAKVSQDMFAELDVAAGLATTDQERAELATLKKLYKRYDTELGEMGKTAVTLGSDVNTGVVGDMRNGAHDAEEVVKGNASLYSSLLLMRRHEKDFIARGAKKYIDSWTKEFSRFTELMRSSGLSEAEKQKLSTAMVRYNAGFSGVSDLTLKLNNALVVLRGHAQEMEPLMSALKSEASSDHIALKKQRTIAEVILFLTFATLFLGVAFVVTRFVSRLGRSILEPLKQIENTVNSVAQGDFDARSKLTTNDELGVVAGALDRMLDDRIAAQVKLEKENDQLNNSVLTLLQGVAQLSRKDLTVKVPVAEDVTGSVSDALNLMTSETAKVLQSVSDISADVTSASLKVQQQSDTVSLAAEAEQREVEQTAQSLQVAATAMGKISELAQVCNQAADNAIKTTQTALETVNSTVSGINATRDIIRETEKRIKRLGERSQEISGVVGLINTIAERTHILALNASMHAASAGEAGRGFAVVADEVQRLAENARQATAQIATLVQNIQVETADTVNTMNAAITQVVEGSRLAETAGAQMQLTQKSTAELAGFVQQIATSSTAQAHATNELLGRAEEIKKSTEQTRVSLQEQGEQTTNLVEYAKNLLSAVRVFKLSA